MFSKWTFRMKIWIISLLYSLTPSLSIMVGKIGGSQCESAELDQDKWKLIQFNLRNWTNLWFPLGNLSPLIDRQCGYAHVILDLKESYLDFKFLRGIEVIWHCVQAKRLEMVQLLIFGSCSQGGRYEVFSLSSHILRAFLRRKARS